MTTNIEWTQETWNPTTGCDRISAGCDNCYALTMAKRLKGMGSAKYQTDGDPRTSGPGFGLAVHPDTLTIPLRWRQPKRVFVNSMSDLFHARVPREFVAQVFAVMAATPQHTYQVLTKRPERMARIVSDLSWRSSVYLHESTLDLRGPSRDIPPWPLPNVWLGTSVENQATADRRIPALLDTPAAARWLSMEPLLGPVDLESCGWEPPSRQGFSGVHNPLTGEWWPAVGDFAEEYRNRLTDLPRLDWVVVGGESGPGSRPMHTQWARDLRDQCVSGGIPFFFKQWGGRTPKANGRELDGRTWDEYPTTRTAVTA